MERTGRVKPEEKEAGRGGNPRGRGERAKEQEGLAPSLGLGEGGAVMGMSSGKKRTHRPSRWFFICACKALLPAAP